MLLTLSGEKFHTCWTLNPQFIADLEGSTSFSEDLKRWLVENVHFMRNPGGFFLYLVENLYRDVGLCVEEVQDVAGVLDSVLGCLFWGGEAVVAGSVEVFEAAGVVL